MLLVAESVYAYNSSTEGDHIKVTASQYPFPTVCADSQSNDWFNSISRTLKWNERERQKSFVVVEESPTRKSEKKRRDGVTPTAADRVAPKANGTAIAEDMDEEDEVSEEEEDEKFDIDDLSSAESPTSSDKSKQSPKEEKRDEEKMKEPEERRDQERAENAARLLAMGNPYLSSREGAAHSSGLKSGVDSPDRFVGPHPHPPRVSPRHVQFAASSTSSSSSDLDAQNHARGERGERDDIHGPRSAHFSTRVRIPRDRDLEAEGSLKTPTPIDPPSHLRPPFGGAGARGRSRSRSHDGPHRRAFAVWGQDESDSAASDSDADA